MARDSAHSACDLMPIKGMVSIFSLLPVTCSLQLCDSMIPIRDQIQSKSYPVVTRGIIGVNILVFLYQMMQGENIERFIYTVRPRPCALLRAGGGSALFLRGAGLRPVLLHVPSRRVPAYPRKHVVPPHLRRQRGRPHGPDPVPSVLPPVRLGFRVCPPLGQLDIDRADNRRQRRHRGGHGGLSHPLPGGPDHYADSHLLHPLFHRDSARSFSWESGFCSSSFTHPCRGPRVEAASPGGPTSGGLCSG